MGRYVNFRNFVSNMNNFLPLIGRYEHVYIADRHAIGNVPVDVFRTTPFASLEQNVNQASCPETFLCASKRFHRLWECCCDRLWAREILILQLFHVTLASQIHFLEISDCASVGDEYISASWWD